MESNNIKKIDGSMGEGGGSVLRLSIALATLKQTPIEIFNIRSNRSTPGLKNQHLSAVRALKKLSNAEVHGDKLNSDRIIFKPGKIESKDFSVEIGTAGSTTLIAQTIMIPGIFANDQFHIKIEGGTDNPSAPPVDYLRKVNIPNLRKLGVDVKLNIKKRGHYPKGGGIIELKTNPITKIRKLRLIERGKIEKIKGVSHCVKLPGHIAKRQAKSAKNYLSERGFKPEIQTEYYEKSEDPHLSPGTGIVLWAKTDSGSILGASSLGKKGKPAEKVGREAAKELMKEINSQKAFDKYLTDQIIPYLALAAGKSEIGTTELTSHTKTNLDILEKILGISYEINGNLGKASDIQIEGIEFESKL